MQNARYSAVAAAEAGARLQAPDAAAANGIATLRVPFRQAARRESARAWIASGTAVTITAYARRYGAGRYTACEDLTATGFLLPDSAQRWAHRPPAQRCPRRPAGAPGRRLDRD